MFTENHGLKTLVLPTRRFKGLQCSENVVQALSSAEIEFRGDFNRAAVDMLLEFLLSTFV